MRRPGTHRKIAACSRVVQKRGMTQVAQTLFPQQVIARKRDGHELGDEEIRAFVRGATDGSWADYQLSAMLMAVYLRGMSRLETAALTTAMMHSGTVADLRSISKPKVDKHSTGGVGDKLSLPLAAMVACCGVAVPMISGRGLGHTGGTLDKLESIPGFRVGLSLGEYRDQVERVGAALIGQTSDLAPADKRLYALRDVTATVECIPLITASILSKKLAEGIDALVLDVKFGRGAFMRTREEARTLARSMVDVAKAMGKPTRALLTTMDLPLGKAVGNALEVLETIECLEGRGPADVMEVTYALGVQMLMLAGVAGDPAEARRRLERSVERGEARAKFAEIVAAQGGDSRVVEDPSLLPKARHIFEVMPKAGAGWVTDVDARAIAEVTLLLGAGRRRADDGVDPAVGVADMMQTGERVDPRRPLARVHANDVELGRAAVRRVESAYTFGECRPDPVSRLVELIE